jgi:hypothetical protein
MKSVLLIVWRRSAGAATPQLILLLIPAQVIPTWAFLLEVLLVSLSFR